MMIRFHYINIFILIQDYLVLHLHKLKMKILACIVQDFQYNFI